MNTTRLDGYESALIGPRSFIVGQSQNYDNLSLYASGGLYGRVIDMPADKAVERGIECDEATANELGRLRVMEALGLALKWARLTGGGAIVALADDGPLYEPIDPSRISLIAELKTFSLPEIAPSGVIYNDPRQGNYGQPQSYRVTKGRAQFLVHESRLIPVSGDPIPGGLRSINIPWAGRSVADRAFPAVMNYLIAQDLAVSILRRKQQAVYKMAGLADAISSGLEAYVQKRINLVDKVRGVLNTVAVDAEDNYDVKDMSLSGVKDVLDELQVALSAETGIPVAMLLGRAPSGMNSTGEFDLSAFYELVAGDQRMKLTPALLRLLGLIYSQQGVTAPEGWQNIQWNPLFRLTNKERAEVRKTNANAELWEMQAMEAAITDGVLDQSEAREYLQLEGRYGLTPTST